MRHSPLRNRDVEMNAIQSNLICVRSFRLPFGVGLNFQLDTASSAVRSKKPAGHESMTCRLVTLPSGAMSYLTDTEPRHFFCWHCSTVTLHGLTAGGTGTRGVDGSEFEKDTGELQARKANDIVSGIARERNDVPTDVFNSSLRCLLCRPCCQPPWLTLRVYTVSPPRGSRCWGRFVERSGSCLERPSIRAGGLAPVHPIPCSPEGGLRSARAGGPI